MSKPCPGKPRGTFSKKWPEQPVMKLLMVTHYFDSHPGGIEFVAREIFRRLARPECEVTWAAADVSRLPETSAHGRSLPLATWNGVEEATGVPFPVPKPGAIKKLWSEVKKSDVLLLHDCLYLSNIVAFLFARIRCKPVVIIQHTGELTSSNVVVNAMMQLGKATIARHMLRSSGQVVFISRNTQFYFRSLRFSRTPLLIFNGVDTDIFAPPEDDAARATLRKAFGLPADCRVVLFVGRFVTAKGLPILEEMARSAPELTWTFAGAGPLDPQDWDLPNVKVFSGLYGHSLARLYGVADVFVLPSEREGFPLVVQEALACGVPVVCSDEAARADDALAPFVRMVPLVAADGRKQQAKDFLRVICQTLQKMPDHAAADRRFQFVKSRYSWSHVADMYYETISELASGPRANRSSNSEAETWQR